MVYGIFTAGQRTWGGPRADAGQADAVTTPQAVIERAEAMDDDLNLVPETFRPIPKPPPWRDPVENARLSLPGRSRVPLHPRASLSMESIASTSSIAQSAQVGHRHNASTVDLEAGNADRKSRAHPPIAPSARFEARGSVDTDSVVNYLEDWQNPTPTRFSPYTAG